MVMKTEALTMFEDKDGKKMMFSPYLAREFFEYSDGDTLIFGIEDGSMVLKQHYKAEPEQQTLF